MYLQYSCPPHLLPNVCKASYTISANIFVMLHIDLPIARIISSLLLYQVPRSGSFTLTNRSKRMDSYRVSTMDIPESPIASGARGETPCIVTKNGRVLYYKVSCHMLHAIPENILVYYDLVPLQF